MSGDTARLQGKFSRRLEEQLRLKRFFKKLFSEVIETSATEVSFQLEGGALNVLLLIDGIEQKRITIKEGWYPLINNWLEQRWAPSEDSCPSEQTSAGRSQEFCIRARKGGYVCSAVVRRDTNSIVLEKIERERVGTLVQEMLDFSKKQQVEFREVLAADKGLIIVVTPQDRQISRGVSTMLGMTGGFFGGNLAEETVRKLAFRLAERELILVNWTARSIGDALDSLSKEMSASWSGLIQGIVGLTFVPALCDNCALPEAMPTALVKQLSAASPPADANYRVAGGCRLCNDSGYLGWKLALQAKALDGETFKFLVEQPGRKRINEYLRGFGCTAFERQAIQFAYQGYASVESLTSSLDSFATKTSADGSIEVDDNYFTLDDTHDANRGRRQTTPMPSGMVQKLISSRDQSLVEIAQETIEKDKLVILVVEDDEDQRSILEVVFKKEGYQVQSVENGLEALGHMNHQKPHLVITDFMMPKLNGKELVASMKADVALQDIPVLVLTVLNDADREYEMLDLGVDDYCDKTVQRKILLKRVENLLRRFYTIS